VLVITFYLTANTNQIGALLAGDATYPASCELTPAHTRPQ
jgi:hypothetical protein